MIFKELAPALASCAKDGGGHDIPAVFCTTREASKDSCHFTHMSPTASGIQCLFEEHWQAVHQWSKAFFTSGLEQSKTSMLKMWGAKVNLTAVQFLRSEGKLNLPRRLMVCGARDSD